MSNIRIGIVGYGNLGRGVEAAVALQPDMELVGVFSRLATLWKKLNLSKAKSMSWYYAAVVPQT